MTAGLTATDVLALGALGHAIGVGECRAGVCAYGWKGWSGGDVWVHFEPMHGMSAPSLATLCNLALLSYLLGQCLGCWVTATGACTARVFAGVGTEVPSLRSVSTTCALVCYAGIVLGLKATNNI